MLHGCLPLLGLFSTVDVATAPPPPPVAASVEGGAAASDAAQDGAPAAAPSPETAPTCEFQGLTGDWGSVRTDLAEFGVTIELSAILEANRVLDGGLAQHTTAHALYDLLVTFDTGRIFGLEDGVVVVDAYAIDGHNPSEDVGDVQSFSDISADETAQIGEVYYEQWLFDHTARVKFGKIDANAEFGSPGVMGEGIHSAAAYSPTAFTMVTYPNPAAGALVGYAFDEATSAKVGVFDGAASRGVATGSNGPATLWGAPSDVLWLGQLERRWTLGENERPGGAVLGTWQHSGGDFTTFGGDPEDATGGWFVAFDQILEGTTEGESPANTLGVFQVGWADSKLAPVDLHVAAGLTFHGVSASRPDDALNLYVSWARFGDDPALTADAETAYEVAYACACSPGVVLRPDLQLVQNAGGDATLGEAVVFSLRLELQF